MRLGLPPDLVRPQLALFGRWAFSRRATWEQRRRRLELGTRFPGPPRRTEVRPGSWGGVAAEELRPPGCDPGRVLLYLHGGGYTTGSSSTHRGMAGRLAAAVGSRAIVLDYRLAPEHPHPAAVDDVRAAWDALAQDGVPPANVAVAGDSAGGGLSVALALALRDDGRPLPAALGLICPWLDLTPETAAARPAALREPLLSKPLLGAFTRAYLTNGADPADPLVSPLHGDLSGLPPIVMHSGGDDLLAGDAARFEQCAREAGLDVEHTCYDGLWHDFHLSGPLMAGPGAGAMAALGSALGRHLRAARRADAVATAAT